MFLVYMMYVKPFIDQRNKIGLSLHILMDFKKTYEEPNMLLPFSLNVEVQKAQWEHMTIISFLADLPLTRYLHIKFHTWAFTCLIK